MCYPVEETLVTSSYKEHCLCELTSGRSQSKHVVTKAAASLLMVQELAEMQYTDSTQESTCVAWVARKHGFLYFLGFSDTGLPGQTGRQVCLGAEMFCAPSG